MPTLRTRLFALVAILLVGASLPGLLAISSDVPDLAVDSLSTAPTIVLAGHSAAIVATIGNHGHMSSTATTVQFLVDDVIVGNVSLPEVPSGSSTMVTLKSTPSLTGGRHVISAYADPLGIDQDLDASNNRLDKTIGVRTPDTGPVDIVATTLRAETRGRSAGQALPIYAILKNAGTVDSGGFSVEFDVDGVTFTPYVDVPPLPANTSAYVPAGLWQVSPGPHVLGIKIDVLDTVIETNESNDHVTSPVFTIAAPAPANGPDLRIDDAYLDAVDAGARVRLVLNVSNHGQTNAPATTARVDFDRFARPPQLIQFPAIPAGGHASAGSAAWVPDGSAINVTVGLDAGALLREPNERDNILTKALGTPRVPTRPTPPADVAVRGVMLTDSSPIDGETVEVIGQVVNAGPGNVSFQAQFRLDDQPLGAIIVVPTLATGEVAPVTSPPFVATAGDHTVKLVVDPANRIPEGNEANNTATIPVHVPTRPSGPPDLFISDVNVGAATLEVGRPAHVHAMLHNAGGAAGASTTLLTMQFGSATWTQVFATPPIERGGVVVLEVDPWVPPTTGTLLVKAFADEAHAVRESDESNNAYVADFDAMPRAAPSNGVIDIRGEIAPVAAAKAGDRMVFQADVSVAQTAWPTPVFQVVLSVDGIAVARETVSDAPKDAIVHIVSAPWTATSGSHVVKLFLDTNDDVRETDETNNEQVTTFEVGA